MKTMKGTISFGNNKVEFDLDNFKREQVEAVMKPHFCALGSYIEVRYEPLEADGRRVYWMSDHLARGGEAQLRDYWTFKVREWADDNGYIQDRMCALDFAQLCTLIEEDQQEWKRYCKATRLS